MLEEIPPPPQFLSVNLGPAPPRSFSASSKESPPSEFLSVKVGVCLRRCCETEVVPAARAPRAAGRGVAPRRPTPKVPGGGGGRGTADAVRSFNGTGAVRNG